MSTYMSVDIFMDYSQNLPKSKRPLVKTSPNWSKRPQKLVKNVPMVENVGQNVPNMIFYSIYYEILGIIWDVLVKLFLI